MSRSQPSLYPDTNILSSLHYNGKSAAGIVRRTRTREWWDLERANFKLVSSQYTEVELMRGTYYGQAAAVAAVKRLPYLPETAQVRNCAALYVEIGLVPRNKVGDALQPAMATVHQIDYVLTWNFAHLANDEVFEKLLRVNRKMGWRSPILISPDTIPRATLGQVIRRSHG